MNYNRTDIMMTGARFDVMCKRCKTRFEVIRNWGGGIRNSQDERKNPALCPNCGSRQLELF